MADDGEYGKVIDERDEYDEEWEAREEEDAVMKAFWAVTAPTRYEEEDEHDLVQGLLAKDLPIGEPSDWRMNLDEDEDED